MSIAPKRINCRLRHGLNVHCLAHIFQYLDSPDLYRVGGMNEFYNGIINDLVIPKHKVNFGQLCKRGITIPEMFERYGKKIQWIIFYLKDGESTINHLFESIIRYCSIDQIKGAEVSIWNNNESLNFPIHFQNVKSLSVYGNEDQFISLQPSESLRNLKLSSLTLNPNFDWTKLRNLTNLSVSDVHGINAQNFIELLHQEPCLKTFCHCDSTFGDSTKDVCDAVARYCGNKIQNYSGTESDDQRNSFSFISGLTNVKKVDLTTVANCGGNLVNTLRLLADNDTVETIDICCWSRPHSSED